MGEASGESTSNFKGQPWWANPSYVAAFAGLVAAIGPLTAFVSGWYEIKLQAQNQAHDIRLRYLDRAIDPSRTVEYHQSVLEFLMHTIPKDDAMYPWAKQRLEESSSISFLIRDTRALENRLVHIRSEQARATDPASFDKEVDDLNQQINALYRRIEEIAPSSTFFRESNTSYLLNRIRLGDREVSASIVQEFGPDDDVKEMMDAEYSITRGRCQYADEDAFECAASVPPGRRAVEIRGTGLKGKRLIVNVTEYDSSGNEINVEELTCDPVGGTCGVEYPLADAQ